jgi:hypothetical protein
MDGSCAGTAAKSFQTLGQDATVVEFRCCHLICKVRHSNVVEAVEKRSHNIVNNCMFELFFSHLGRIEIMRSPLSDQFSRYDPLPV